MIQPLRTRHRRIFLVLALVLPVLFAAALLVRDEVPAPVVIHSAGGGR